MARCARMGAIVARTDATRSRLLAVLVREALRPIERPLEVAVWPCKAGREQDPMTLRYGQGLLSQEGLFAVSAPMPRPFRYCRPSLRGAVFEAVPGRDTGFDSSKNASRSLPPTMQAFPTMTQACSSSPPGPGRVRAPRRISAEMRRRQSIIHAAMARGRQTVSNGSRAAARRTRRPTSTARAVWKSSDGPACRGWPGPAAPNARRQYRYGTIATRRRAAARQTIASAVRRRPMRRV